jgi:dipeptidase
LGVILLASIVFLAAFLIVPGGAGRAEGCFVVAAGRGASASGRVIIGHNEDNRGELVMRHHYMPDGAASGTMQFESGAAAVPRAWPTLGFFWTETLRPTPGEPFGDSFVNELGVVIVSNNCLLSNESAPELFEGGIGWGLRRIVAERARSARDAVRVASELVLEYGYRGLARSYTFADSRDVWAFQVANGRHFAARRLPDDHVMINPNHYSIRELDPDDEENSLISPGLIEHAIKRGWYSPAKPGRYDDFDFAGAFQHPDYVMVPLNADRSSFGMSRAAGAYIRLGSGERPPFSVRPTKPLTLEGIVSTLGCHCERPSDFKDDGDWRESPHAGGREREDLAADECFRICNDANKESLIVETHDNPDETVIWSCFGSPCALPMTPWHLGARAIPALFAGSSSNADSLALSSAHFSAESSDVARAAPEIWDAYRTLASWYDADYSRRLRETSGMMTALRRRIASSHSDFESSFPRDGRDFSAQASRQARTVLDGMREITWG